MARRNSYNNHGNSHRGVSILEVLFAILITAIGLMGAIAVFPAAIMQAKRGQQADSTAAAGLRCIHDFDAQGLRRPDRWLTYNGSAYLQVTDATCTVPPNGSRAYCIDPRFMAANASDTSANNVPYSATTSVMQRVSLHNGLTGASAGPMSALLAEMNFRIEDDLAYDRFNDKIAKTDETMHAASLFVRNAANDALKRESHGHMSWIATLSPKLERYPSGITFEDRYVLSVVVFYDRPVQLLASGSYPASEWSLTVNMATPTYGGGIGGGDMQLTGTTADQVDIRKDQWIMLMSYTLHPTSVMMGQPQRTAPLCRWYRVIDADEPDATTNTVDVTLSGADWENTGQTVYAVVMKGVVAVYEKTIKLETRL